LTHKFLIVAQTLLSRFSTKHRQASSSFANNQSTMAKVLLTGKVTFFLF
jgi:hypothetical protein